MLLQSGREACIGTSLCGLRNGTLFKVRTTVADSPRDQLLTHWSRVGGTHPLLLLIPSTSSKPKAGQHRKHIEEVRQYVSTYRKTPTHTQRYKAQRSSASHANSSPRMQSSSLFNRAGGRRGNAPVAQLAEGTASSRERSKGMGQSLGGIFLCLIWPKKNPHCAFENLQSVASSSIGWVWCVVLSHRRVRACVACEGRDLYAPFNRDVNLNGSAPRQRGRPVTTLTSSLALLAHPGNTSSEIFVRAGCAPTTARARVAGLAVWRTETQGGNPAWTVSTHCGACHQSHR
jgi:hypothetical protein